MWTEKLPCELLLARSLQFYSPSAIVPPYPDRAILHCLSTAPPMSCSKSDDCHADKGKCVAGMCFCDGFFVGNGVVCRGEVEMSMSMKPKAENVGVNSASSPWIAKCCVFFNVSHKMCAFPGFAEENLYHFPPLGKRLFSIFQLVYECIHMFVF